MLNLASAFILLMKHCAVYVLSFVIVVINAQFGLQLAIYEIFKPSIIEQFCINKDVPDSQCEAMCFMKDNVLEEGASKKEPASSEQTMVVKLVEADFRNTQIYLLELIGTDRVVIFPSYSIALVEAPLQAPYTPPQA
jgi:hypothetical protein